MKPPKYGARFQISRPKAPNQNEETSGVGSTKESYLMDYRDKYQFVNLQVSVSDRHALLETLRKIYPDRKSRVYKCMICYLANLQAYPYRYAPRGKAYFNRVRSGWFKLPFATEAMDLLEKNSFISVQPGFRSKGFTKGVATRLSQGPEFSKFLLSDSLPIILEEETPELTWRGHAFWLNRNKSTPEYRLMSNVPELRNRIILVHEYRELMESTKISLFDDNYSPTMRRIIPPNFLPTACFDSDEEYDLGLGRLFQKGGISYQNIPKEERLHLKLDERDITESDYKGCFWYLLYWQRGLQYPLGDPYLPVMEELGVCNPDIRAVVKVAGQVILNCRTSMSEGKLPVFVRAMKYKSRRRILWLGQLVENPKRWMRLCLEKEGLAFEDVFAAYFAAHKPVVGYLGLPMRHYRRLQFYESEIITNVAVRLARSGIRCLSLHDSAISEMKWGEKVKEIMLEEYEKYTRMRILVE